jgi:hypothetical protein
MNCKRCHHTDEIHILNEKSSSIIKAGKCQIPNCTCQQYVDPIQVIDEDLL